MPEKVATKAKRVKNNDSPLIEEEVFWPEEYYKLQTDDSPRLKDTGGSFSPGDSSLLYGMGNSQQFISRSLNLGRDSYIWCFAGPRGAGKTSLMTFIAEQCGYLYNKRIISNYPIKLRIWSAKAKRIIEIESEPLELGKLLMFDESYKGAIIVMDEAPQIINRLATMTWKNRLLDLWLQQIRKNGNSLLYASQNEFWVDNELRWQTDVISSCRDASILYPGYEKGSMILTQIRDMSGLWTGYSFEEKPRIVKKQKHLTKLIWGTFDTHHKNDVFASLAKVKMNVDEIQVGVEGGSDEDYLTHTLPIIRASMEGGKIKKREFTQAIGYDEMGGAARAELYKRLRYAGMTDYGQGNSSLNFTDFNMEKFLSWQKPKRRR